MKKLLLFLSVFLFFLKDSFAESKDPKRTERQEAMIEAIKVAQEKIEEEKEISLFRRIILNIRPYLDLKTEYSTNIYKTPTNEEQDFVITTTPGLRFETRGRFSSLKLDLSLEAITYTQNPDANQQNIKFLSSFSFTPPQGYSLSLSDVIQRRSVPKTYFEYGVRGFTRYLQNTFDLIFDIERHRLGFDLGFKRYDFDYEPVYSLLNDRNESIYTLTGYFKVAPKTRLLLEYNYGIIKYRKKPSPSKDSDYNQLRLGVKGEITPKLTGIIKTGYQARNYKEKKDWNQLVVSADLEYKASGRTSYLLSLERAVEESIYIGEHYYEKNEISLIWNHRLAFNPKFKLSLSGSYGYDRYPERGGIRREDKIRSFGLSLAYEMRRWFTLSLGFSQKARDSNQDFDYKIRVFGITTKTTF